MRFITLAKAAEEIGVSVTTIKRWTRLADRPLRTAMMGAMRVTSSEWLDEFARPVDVESPEHAEASEKIALFHARWGSNQPIRTVG